MGIAMTITIIAAASTMGVIVVELLKAQNINTVIAASVNAKIQNTNQRKTAAVNVDRPPSAAINGVMMTTIIVLVTGMVEIVVVPVETSGSSHIARLVSVAILATIQVVVQAQSSAKF